MGIQRTGKFFDAATRARLHTLALEAKHTPAVVVSQRWLGPSGKTEAELAWSTFWRELNAAAVAAGFAPPALDGDGDVVNYGCDFVTGEILAWDGVTDGTEGQIDPPRPRTQ